MGLKPNLWRLRHYFLRYIRIIVAFPVGHFILINHQTKSVWVIITQANYWIGLVFSVAVAYGVLTYVHRITGLLDRTLPWEDNWFKRLELQFFLGVVMPITFVYAAVRFFFYCFTGDFEASGYMEREFIEVRWMIPFLNLFYFAWYFATSDKKLRITREEAKPTKEGQLIIQMDGIRLEVPIQLFVAFVKLEIGGILYLLNGEQHSLDMKLTDLQAYLPRDAFIQINRWTLVAINHIVDYTSDHTVIMSNDIQNLIRKAHQHGEKSGNRYVQVGRHYREVFSQYVKLEKA
ncbi:MULTISPECIES: LytTR family transcriptional regulator DNA-binding domain-containing protein [Olivibacter]|uniref:LytTR family transcriptional regulator DNA-binding domain-containing protein n=1 Tax=Olivibacter jilunii TaxID=985016 RepID=A0ABW6AVW2_9SPHI